MKQPELDPETLAQREAQFNDELKRFDFRFRCEDCAHVIPSTMSCSMRYPNADLTGPVRGLQSDGTPTSCKYWEFSESA